MKVNQPKPPEEDTIIVSSFFWLKNNILFLNFIFLIVYVKIILKCIMKIAKLKEVDIRTLWKHEEYDFSNWLVQNKLY